MYEVPVPKASLPENRFEFGLPVGEKKVKVSFPKLEFVGRDVTKLFIAQAKKRDKMKDDGEQFMMWHEVEEWIEIYSHILPAHAKDFEALSDDQVMAISSAWLDASKVDVPESEASSDS